jgi:hypothetical protein
MEVAAAAAAEDAGVDIVLDRVGLGRRGIFAASIFANPSAARWASASPDGTGAEGS